MESFEIVQGRGEIYVEMYEIEQARKGISVKSVGLVQGREGISVNGLGIVRVGGIPVKGLEILQLSSSERGNF